ncbi:unnamed protein product [Amoebophrya sp. A25]|nr:unnamed protein product [Amoebophrya sp. A25]|eukprot:GSA25T00019117001.1
MCTSTEKKKPWQLMLFQWEWPLRDAVASGEAEEVATFQRYVPAYTKDEAFAARKDFVLARPQLMSRKSRLERDAVLWRKIYTRYAQGKRLEDDGSNKQEKVIKVATNYGSSSSSTPTTTSSSLVSSENKAASTKTAQEACNYTSTREGNISVNFKVTPIVPHTEEEDPEIIKPTHETTRIHASQKRGLRMLLLWGCMRCGEPTDGRCETCMNPDRPICDSCRKECRSCGTTTRLEDGRFKKCGAMEDR